MWPTDLFPFFHLGSKLDIRRYIEGTDIENFECELRRHSPTDSHVRWPVQAPSDHNFWFISNIKHTNGHFALTSVLRHPSVQPSSSQSNRNKPTIIDGDVLTTMGESHEPTLSVTFWFSPQSYMPFSRQTSFSQRSWLWKLNPPQSKQELVSRKSSTVSLQLTTRGQIWQSSGSRNSTAREDSCLATPAGRGTLREGVLTSRASQVEMPPIPSPILKQPVKARTFVQSWFHQCLLAWT